MPKDIAKTPNFAPSDAAFVRDPGRAVLAHGHDLAAGAGVAPHHHPRGQLIWAAEGVLRVMAADAVWIVPPSHAVWIPGGVVHQVVTETAAKPRNLYVDASMDVRGDDCAVLLLSPLMREIILRLVADDGADADVRQRLGLVAIDEIRRLDSAPLRLPAGQDPRLRRLTGLLASDPADRRSLPELAAIAGASPRTLERLSKAETGMTLRQWRSRLRLLKAIERLARGESSTTIAYSLGYRSASAFVAAFHAQFACPPQRFLSASGWAIGPAPRKMARSIAGDTA